MVSIRGTYKRRDPENAPERVHEFIMDKPLISGVGITGILALLFFRIIPLSWLSILPGGTAKFLIMVVIANALAFLPARWLYKRIRTFPIDFIFEANVGKVEKNEDGTEIVDAEEKVKVFQYYEGNFLRDYEFVEGRPTTWNNVLGKTAYLVREIDEENKEVRCAQYGELNDLQQIQAIENIRENRLRNRKFAKLGIKIISKAQTFEDQVKSEYFASLVTKGMELTSYDSDTLMDSIRDVVPEMDVFDEDDEDDTQKELESVLEDIGGDVDAELNLKPSGKGEKTDG